jgi:hypothetical protein
LQARLRLTRPGLLSLPEQKRSIAAGCRLILAKDTQMARRVSEWLYRVSTGRAVLAAIVLFLLFLRLVLPYQAARSREETGADVSPDQSLLYTPADLFVNGSFVLLALGIGIWLWCWTARSWRSA